MDGPWGHDARDVATTRTDRRDTAVRGTLPLGAFLSRPPAPALATSQDTALPGLKSQSVPGASLGPGQGSWAQWGPARLLRCTLDAPRGLARASSPETPGSAAALPAAASRAGAQLGTAAPNCVPSCPPWSPPLAPAGSPGPRSSRVSCPSRPKPEGLWDGRWLIGLGAEEPWTQRAGRPRPAPASSEGGRVETGQALPQESLLHAEPWDPRQG